MTWPCEHYWLIARWTWRKPGLRLRVRCSWCGKQKLWLPEQGRYAANWFYWRDRRPTGSASSG